MNEFHTYLVFEAGAGSGLEEADQDKEGVVDALKSAICANINLFMEMNEEEFAKFLNTFVADVWTLLLKVSTRPGQVCVWGGAASSSLTSTSTSTHARTRVDRQVDRQSKYRQTAHAHTLTHSAVTHSQGHTGPLTVTRRVTHGHTWSLMVTEAHPLMAPLTPSQSTPSPHPAPP